MKYAFIIGSNAFIVPHNGIVYNAADTDRDFLRINSIYHEVKEPAGNDVLDIDLNIKDTDGSSVIIVNNKPVTGAPYTIERKPDSVKVLRIDGSTIIHVHQLDEDTALGLEHNIVAELELQAPLAAIRVTGEFYVDGLHIRAENEKLLINENGYATSAMIGKNKLAFTSEGVVL